MTVITPPGRLVRDEQGLRLQFDRTLPFPAAHVWAALTERNGSWIGTWSGDPASGGVRFRMTAEEGAEESDLRVDACVAPSRLEVVMDGPDGPWPLSVTLTPDGASTGLVLVHRLAEPYDARDVGPGWHYYLDRLASVAAGEPVDQDWDDYHPALRADYPLPT